MAGRSSSSARRSAAVQRLIDSADQSLSLLASLGDASSASASVETGSSLRFGPDDDAMDDAPDAREAQDEGDDGQDARLLEPVVNASVRRGLLHVKGVFPDQSTEFVDVDPRVATVGDLKRALCGRRDSAAALGFSAKEARVLFGGQLVEDAWLVVDCGMGFEGAIHIVQAAALAGSFLSRAPGGLFDGKTQPRADPKLSISSIASVYAAQQPPPLTLEQLGSGNDQVMSQLATFKQSLSLSLATVPSARGDLFSRHVRPEEASFADMAADFYENLERVQDSDLYCEKLLSGYIDVLQTRLEKLEATLASSSKARGAPTAAQQRLQTDIKELRDERNTWRLLFELRQVCHASKEMADGEDSLMMLGAEAEELRFEMLEDDALRLLETRNETYKIQRAVKAWLESMALESTISISDKRGATGSRTLRMMKKQVFPGEEVRMDPDAVLRDGDDHVLPDDMEDEAELMKASWRAASLSGGNPVGASETNEREDMAMERWGNPFRALWKAMCWRLSEQAVDGKLSKSNSLLAKKYEELIYAALSGNVQVITKSNLCENWEDHCWAYLQGITEQQVDEILYKLLKVKSQSSQLIVGNNAHYLRHYSSLLDKTKYLKRYQVDLDTLFNELRGSQSELVRMQANQPHRQIQAKLVTAKFQYIVSSILDTLLFNPEDDSYNWDLQLNSTVQSDETSSLFLRFAAHFIMFANFTGELFDEQAGHMILKLYIRHLVKHRQLQFVPVYASRLPTAGAIEIYVQMLSTVEDRLERELCIKRILECAGMEVLSTVLQSVVERLCEEYRLVAQEQQQKKGQPISSDVPTTEIDRKRIRTIEFLCFYTEHRAEALVRANMLTRQFLLEGKFAAVKELVEESLPEDSIGVLDLNRATQLLRDDDEIERAMRESLCWRAYIQASAQYDLWRNCINNPGAEALSLYSEEKDYLTDLMFHVSRSAAATLEVLHFENGWLMGCSNDATEDASIRERCLPTLVFNLHFIQLESAKTIMRLNHYPEDAKAELARPLLEKSIEVADVVADEHYGVYHALDQDQCRDLLHGFRESAVSLAFVESMPTPVISPDIDQE
ncbi:nuclear pore complex protein nup107 isoform x1 [Phytophthora cinnamomi]|uniref:nuclear pore complex protein nup107 isoform x1 n=1 Tax=Phytophthora cinnamomi TaxID=4785 RepID=UPI00355A41B5|nr:nuclear pore complex protein nup107 isoform x1 [Phytophthora cinnamomi]